METAASKKPSKILPSNAYTKLEPGQEYQPIVPANDRRAEVTVWSVTLGLIMVVVFSAACIYMALRAGNAIEAAIPIAIMAIFFGRKGLKRSGKSTILENVMVQSIGQAAGVVAAGAAFIIPAFYINGLDVHWWQTFLACSIGGFLGIVLIIPLRKYFVKDLHGDLPFPEATAINEILVSGESTSASAGKVLLAAFGLGAAYDFVVEAVHAWNPMMTTQTLLGGLGEKMSAIRLDLSMNGLAALFGLGYIIGLRYAAVIAAGSVFGCLVLTPLILPLRLADSPLRLRREDLCRQRHRELDSDAIFDAFVKPIGIGAIAVSGHHRHHPHGQDRRRLHLAWLQGTQGRRRGGGAAHADRYVSPQRAGHPVRLDASHGAAVFRGGADQLATPAAARPFRWARAPGTRSVGAVVGFALSFLFTPVAAQAIAIVGVNPVSGMTLITVVLTILALVATGLKGTGGMFIALVVGCAVCTALSTSGALISDFKIGYWIGSTPRNQEIWKFAGIILASLVVAFVIPVMDSGYHFLVPDPATGQWSPTRRSCPLPRPT